MEDLRLETSAITSSSSPEGGITLGVLGAGSSEPESLFEFEFEAELEGNISIPHIYGLENTTFEKIIIKGKAKMPVYFVKGIG